MLGRCLDAKGGGVITDMDSHSEPVSSEIGRLKRYYACGEYLYIYDIYADVTVHVNTATAGRYNPLDQDTNAYTCLSVCRSYMSCEVRRWVSSVPPAAVIPGLYVPYRLPSPLSTLHCSTEDRPETRSSASPLAGGTGKVAFAYRV